MIRCGGDGGDVGVFLKVMGDGGFGGERDCRTSVLFFPPVLNDVSWIRYADMPRVFRAEVQQNSKKVQPHWLGGSI